VLRRRLPEWLAEPALAALSAGYAPAHARHGGEGAWYVFLKRPARDGS
jgi:DNA-nicking Smr family endonuclease